MTVVSEERESPVDPVGDGRPGARPLRAARAWAATAGGRYGAEVAFVSAVVVAIQLLVFRGWYLGTTSPSGDFLGPYNTEAFAWWRDGGLLDPPEWTPYVWGGFPTAASIQNSSWYLPVGLAGIFDYDLHMAAALQGLHVAFAGVGVYVLGRRAGFGRPAATLGLVAYSLSTGFFSNAGLVDIVRGHAFAPWLLLLLSPLFPWRRWWSVPLAAVFLWQVAVSTYPGMLVAFAYAGGAWAVTWQLAKRTPARHFLLPAVLAAVLAVLLSMPKYLPLLGLGLMAGREVSDLSVLTPASLGTFLLPEYAGLPGTFSMQSFFLPAAAILLAALVSFRDVTVRAALVAAVVAVLLAAPNLPLRGLVDALPGLGVSRFRVNDFRPFVVLPIVVAAMSGLGRLLDGGVARLPGWALLGRVVLVAAVPAAAAVFLVFGHFRESPWVDVTVVLGATTVVVLLLLVVARRSGLSAAWRRVAVTGVLVALTAASGLVYSGTAATHWNIDTLAWQNQLWGATSAQLIEQRVDPAPAVQRPARTEMPRGYGGPDLIAVTFNSASYTGTLSTGGRHNVQNSPAYTMAAQALQDLPTADAARALWAAPGIVISRWIDGTGLPDRADVEKCVDTGRCGSVTVEPMDYEPGHVAYRVEARAAEQVLLNEAYYVGWSALLVDDAGRARTLPVQNGPAGMLMLDLPEGSWRLSLTYRTPLKDPADMLGGLGLLGLLAVTGVGLRRQRRSRPWSLTPFDERLLLARPDRSGAGGATVPGA